ncbi:MAG: hypothetical protein DMG58_05275 [Acidobacteria bacterium]|nr:MAG: hypothetical protein DMG58_05275 [Acidobacteriota bacterium]
MQKPRTRKWWLWYGTLAWGMPFFVLMTVFWGIVLFVVTSLLERRLNWKFYADPRIHAAGLLVFSLAVSLLGGCYWGSYMWKFYESERRHAETELESHVISIVPVHLTGQLSGQISSLRARVYRPMDHFLVAVTEPTMW